MSTATTTTSIIVIEDDKQQGSAKSPSTGAGPTTKSASPTPHQLPQPTMFTSSGTPSDVQQIWTAYGAQSLWKFKIGDLKNELRMKNLDTTGNKPTIICRLNEQYMAELAQSQGAITGNTFPIASEDTDTETTRESSDESVLESKEADSPLNSPIVNKSSAVHTHPGPQQPTITPPSLHPAFSASGSAFPPYVSMQHAFMNSGFYPSMSSMTPVAPPQRVTPPPKPKMVSTKTSPTTSNTSTTASPTTTTSSPSPVSKPSATVSPPGSSKVSTVSSRKKIAQTSSTKSTSPITSTSSPSSATSTPTIAAANNSNNTTPVKQSATAAVLSSETPLSPVVPKTDIQSIRSSFRPTISIPKLVNPACDPSAYSSFSPASAQFMPHAFSGSPVTSGVKKVRKVIRRVVKSSSNSASTTTPATTTSNISSTNTKAGQVAKPPRQQKASSKLKVKKKDSVSPPSTTTTVTVQQIATPALNVNGTVQKRRGRPPKNRASLSITPSPITKTTKIVKRTPKDLKKIDAAIIASGDLRKLGKDKEPVISQIEDSQASDFASESDMDGCTLDNYLNMDDDSLSSMSTSINSDFTDSFLTATDLNLDTTDKNSRKRALMDDDFYGMCYSSDGSPSKKPRRDEDTFICETVQEVPENILESALMEETLGACQSEYCFEVTLAKNKSSESNDGCILTMMDEEFETRKLSVGGSVSLHDLTKSVLELFAYDRYGGMGADLGIDSDSSYILILPCGRELTNPEIAVKPKVWSSPEYSLFDYHCLTHSLFITEICR
jgi:hypothetical protein